MWKTSVCELLIKEVPEASQTILVLATPLVGPSEDG